MSQPPRIIIAGGGFSGTLVAVHLLRRNPDVRIDLIDSRAPGRGLAYSTVWDDHLLNVPAVRMSAFGDQPLHFLEWLRTHGMPSAEPGAFAPRKVFGAYIQHALETTVRNARRPFLHHMSDAVAARFDGANAEVLLANGEKLTGTRLILACGHTTPRTVATGFASPWEPVALAHVPPDRDVLLIGAGLTAIDAFLALRASGHRGRVHVVSRRGKLPHAHQPYHPSHDSFHPSGTLGARQLLRAVRRQTKAAFDRGDDWRAVIDSLRPITNDIWAELAPPEQRRVLRHLKTWWDIHRHRMAPEIGAKVEAARSQGTLIPYAGRVRELIPEADKVHAHIDLRTGGTLHLEVERVINCTGSDDDYRKSTNPLIRSLLASRWIQPGPLGRGLATSKHGELIDATGAASDWLFTLGGARFGQLFETTAVPELRKQAEALANHLSSILTEPIEIAPELYIAMGI